MYWYLFFHLRYCIMSLPSNYSSGKYLCLLGVYWFSIWTQRNLYVARLSLIKWVYGILQRRRGRSDTFINKLACNIHWPKTLFYNNMFVNLIFISVQILGSLWNCIWIFIFTRSCCYHKTLSKEMNQRWLNSSDKKKNAFS